MNRLTVEQMLPTVQDIVANLEVGHDIDAKIIRKSNALFTKIRATEITMCLQYLAGRGMLKHYGSKHYAQCGNYMNFRRIKVQNKE